MRSSVKVIFCTTLEAGGRKTGSHHRQDYPGASGDAVPGRFIWSTACLGRRIGPEKSIPILYFMSAVVAYLGDQEGEVYR